MAKVLLKLLQYVYCVYAILLFAIIMLLAFPFIMIAVPFGIKGGNFIYIVCKIWARTWYLFVGIQHKEIFETPHNNQQQYIFVQLNHISYMDIPPIVCSAKQPIRVLKIRNGKSSHFWLDL
jgi:1-acyl-sn-glycerol-3-phosphate acyltransferase